MRKLLIRRFGSLLEWAEAKLTMAELAQLEAWGERVLEAKTLEGVFAGEQACQPLNYLVCGRNAFLKDRLIQKSRIET